MPMLMKLATLLQVRIDQKRLISSRLCSWAIWILCVEMCRSELKMVGCMDAAQSMRRDLLPHLSVQQLVSRMQYNVQSLLLEPLKKNRQPRVEHERWSIAIIPEPASLASPVEARP